MVTNLKESVVLPVLYQAKETGSKFTRYQSALSFQSKKGGDRSASQDLSVL